MKLLIEIEDSDETALVALAEAEMRSKTAQAKKLLVDSIRRESGEGSMLLEDALAKHEAKLIKGKASK